MVIVRLLLFLALASIAVALLLYVFKRDRRYLRFIWQVVKFTLLVLIGSLGPQGIQEVETLRNLLAKEGMSATDGAARVPPKARHMLIRWRLGPIGCSARPRSRRRQRTLLPRRSGR